MSNSRQEILELVLGRFYYKEDVQDIAEELDLPVSGTKDDLIERIVEDSDYDPADAIGDLDKGELQDLCDELEIDSSGTKEELANRVLRTIKEEDEPAPPGRGPAAAAPPAYAQQYASAPPPPPPPEGWVPPAVEPAYTGLPNAYVQPPAPAYQQPQAQPGVLPPAYGTPPGLSPHLEDVTEFVRTYQPPQQFRDEQRYKDFLTSAIAQKFGSESVRQEMPVTGGRIDIDLYYQIGIELKFPTSQGDLDRLVGQAQKYQRHYGPNLIVVLFGGGYNQRDLAACRNYLERLGVRAFLK